MAQNVAMDGGVVWTPPKTYKAMQKMCHDDLTRAEVASLKFLCKDLMSAGKLEDITDTLKLFAELETLGLMTSEQNMSILIEMLYYINRKDILTKLLLTREYISAVLDRPKISSYRILLFNICENILKKDLEDLKFLCGDIGLASSAVESVKTAEDLILLLERSGKLNEDDFSSLESLLTNACKLDLVQRIAEYKRKHQSGQKIKNESTVTQPVDARVIPAPYHNIPDHFIDMSITGVNVREENHVASDREANSHDSSTRHDHPDGTQKGTRHDVPAGSQVEKDIGDDALDSYPMIKPGFCFIINNRRFVPGGKHKDRDGTEYDEANLKDVFERILKFKVHVKNDLRAQQMVDEIWRVSRALDNDQYGCFVCCILTHGADGTVYGVDNVMVSIRGLMEMFKVEKCPGMRNKPKIFFLQACQGTKRDIYVDALPEMDDPSSCTPGSGSIPSERDFLLAYSAVPGYASFRSRSSGTYFISTLVEVIREKHKTTNLMEMLTLVTGRVSRIRAPMEVKTRDSNGKEIKIMKEFYQVPAPMQTLTKLLYWR